MKRTETLPADLAAAADAYEDAQLHGSSSELERLLHDDYLLINSTGACQSKAEFIRDLTDAEYSLEPYTITDQVVRVWPSGAVISGITTLTGVDHGRPFSFKMRFADVWAKHGGQWQVIFTQVGKC